MDAFLKTFDVGNALTLIGWIAGGLTAAVGFLYTIKSALKEIRALRDSFESFTREARSEIDALNTRVDGVADRTSRLEERQAMHESLLGRIEQSVREELRYIRERVDIVFLHVTGNKE